MLCSIINQLKPLLPSLEMLSVLLKIRKEKERKKQN